MNTEVAIDIFKNTIVFALYMVAPFLGAALVIGLITSLIQSVTSIQEATLSFAPKLLVMSVVAIALAPWILKSMTDFTIEMFAKMVELGH
ncbi:flagellar biosynthetic protein FliQ [mine drainage metagenome]|uniref:Flagellar biosynthetic protein FliQ n=1 Tax=mine drainage metagenome TaxID=410659 RepID=A0A1J5TCZ8_9ZZZZ